MKTYRGQLPCGEYSVTVEDDDGTTRPLPPRLDLRNHSPTGLAWGYCGSGPAQLSLAILADVLSDPADALRLYQDFKRQVIADLDSHQPWDLDEAAVRAWAEEHREAAVP